MPPPISPICALTVLSWQLGELDLADLWWRYSALGGSADRLDLELYLNGVSDWVDHEHDVLSQALNEALWDNDQASMAPVRGTCTATTS